MAQLTPDQFSAKWIPLLANNVFQDIDGVRLGQLVVDIKDTFGAATGAVNVPDWIAGTYYPLGYLILRSFGGPAIFMKASQVGYLPVPSDPLGDANWAPALGPVVASTYQVGTVPALRHSRGDWVPGRLYILQNRISGTQTALPDVYVRALSEVELEPRGYAIDALGTPPEPVPVEYDLVTDTTTAQLGRVVDQQQALRLAAADRLDMGTYIVLDDWNGIPGGGVLLTPISRGVFGTIGYIYQSRAIPVLVDLYALTYKLLNLDGSQFLPYTYTVQAADLPEPHITVPNAAAFGNKVGILGKNGSFNELFYGVGYTVSGNVITILAATNVQAGEVISCVYLAGTSQVPSEQLAQHTTSDGLRGTGPFQFRNRRPSGLALTIISNVAMVAAQVNYRDTNRDGIWIPGQIYTSTGNSDAELVDLLADVEADIAAVPAPALAIAAEVIFRTQPIDAKLESDFFLSGLRSGAFFGRASFFRTSYTGPPIGQVLNNPQFTDASGWDVPYGGATLGGGAANLFGRTTGDHLIEVRQSQTIQAGDYYFEIEIVQLDKGSVSLEIGQNGTIQKKWPLFAVGTYKYDVTLATSAQYDVYLHSFDAGIIISHVYLVPK